MGVIVPNPTVETEDGSVSVTNVKKIEVTDGDLTDDGGRIVSISTASGAASGGTELLASTVVDPTNYKYWNIGATPPYGFGSISSTQKLQSKGIFMPWVAAQSGAITEMGIDVDTAHSGGKLYAAVYTSGATSKGPETLMGYTSFSTTSTGTVLSSSFSSTITTVQGTTYWYFTICDTADTTSNARFQMLNSTFGVSATGGPEQAVSAVFYFGLRYTGANEGIPESSITLTDLEGSSYFAGGAEGNPAKVVVAWT